MLSTQIVSGVAKQHGDINGTSTRKKVKKKVRHGQILFCKLCFLSVHTPLNKQSVHG